MSRSVRIALPKGRLYDRTTELLRRAGIGIEGEREASRRLLVADASGEYEFIPLKPIDIPVYVESGAIDGGVVGSDILREVDADVYEPVNLEIGRCRLVLAAPQGVELSALHSLRLATKYPRTAEQFFRNRRVHVHIVRLEGSVEIAPLLGLADAIVDLVETGRTLKDNGMAVVEEIAVVSAIFIVNRTSLKMKSAGLGKLIKRLDSVVYENT